MNPNFVPVDQLWGLTIRDKSGRAFYWGFISDLLSHLGMSPICLIHLFLRLRNCAGSLFLVVLLLAVYFYQSFLLAT